MSTSPVLARLIGARTRSAPGGGLGQLVRDVIGAADANPASASAIFADASEKFAAFAGRQTNPRGAALLLGFANDFAARASQAAPAQQQRATTDDFEEIEREHAQAHRDVGDLGDFEIAARRAQLASSRQGAGPQPISILPSLKNGRIGNQVAVKFQPSSLETQQGVAQETTCLIFQGKKEESQSFTIDSNILSIVGLGVGFAARPYMKVQIGADAFQGLNVTCDVGAGIRVTGAGNYVSVAFGADPPPAGAVSSVINVGAGLGFFSAPSLAPVTRTIYIDGLGILAVSPVIPRPARAVVLLPILSTSLVPGDTYTISFLDVAGNVISSKIFSNNAVFPTQVPQAVVLPNDCRSFQLSNSGSVVTDFRLICQLAL